MRLETKLETLLPEGNGPFDVIAHELWRDSEGGWTVNDSWRIAKEVDRYNALRALRGRWEVFKANYLPKARVCDLQDAGCGDGESLLEVDCTAFAEVRTIQPEETR